MSELKHQLMLNKDRSWVPVYLKSEADKVIAEKDAEICRLKNGIAPKYSDKTLQERLNEVCEKHGVSTLQDLDWAFCESEKRQTNYFIEAAKEITHHKHKRCLAMAMWCCDACDKWMMRKAKAIGLGKDGVKEYHQARRKLFHYMRWQTRWLELAEKFKDKEAK